MKLYARGMDYYCPHCHREYYAPAVADILEDGGNCCWCGKELEKGEQDDKISSHKN